MAKIDLSNKTILITGSSGFIGFNLCKALLEQFGDIQIIGIDNMNDYYDVSLKEYRLSQLQKYSNYTFIKGDISDKYLVNKVFAEYKPSIKVSDGKKVLSPKKDYKITYVNNTQADYEKANRVAAILQEMVDESEGDPNVFRNEYQRRVKK